MKVLVVDDHSMLRKVMVQVLGSEIEVVEASHGDEAIRQFGSHRPDVVFMDIRMPGMDGIETTREILRRWPGARVHILSSSTSKGDRDAARAAGARGYIAKPMLLDDLRTRLHRALGFERTWLEQV